MLASPWGFLFEHPILGLAIFAIVTLGVIFFLAEGRLGDAVVAIFRVFLTIFTTPFLFLRAALTNLRNSRDSERDYQYSRVFMLFRLNQIQYLVLLLVCLLTLAGGITMSALSFYPQAEIEQGRLLSQEVEQLQAELDAANQASSAALAPSALQALQARSAEAANLHQQQVQQNAEFVENATYRNRLFNQLAGTRSMDYVTQVRDSIDQIMAECPRAYIFREMNAGDCAPYRALVLDLAERKANEINLAQAAADAETAWRDAEAAAQAAAGNVADIQARLDLVRQQRGEVSLYNPAFIGERLKRGALQLLATIWSVVVLVWFGAIFIEVMNWIILMMRSLEKTQSEKLEQARAERR